MSSQAQVNAFNCSEIGGNLIIQGEDITDLSPLSGLTKVGGGLIIVDNPQLKEIKDF
ncbi:MAG: hypothetical protein HC880_14635 [Bacteroidia bacterium]|nr:hypothetical protein [Bacteroidia bacterium]